MMKFILNFFSCDKKASRKEFIIYFIIYSILIIFFIPLIFSYRYLTIIPFILVFLFTFPIFRRAKDRGMTNETIINYLIKISLLLWAGILFSMLVVYFTRALFIESFSSRSDFLWSTILYYIATAYSLIFFFQLLFLKGKDNEKEIDKEHSTKPTLPKICEMFNRDFIIKFFDFKGKTTREEGFIYLGLGFICSVIILMTNNMLVKIIKIFRVLFFLN